jgi:Zn-finger nucleic acid-binding protein
MRCPKCLSDMETITFNDVEIDRCLDCYGIWFDHLERSRLAGLKGAESIAHRR